jgi:hypothetical protein
METEKDTSIDESAKVVLFPRVSEVTATAATSGIRNNHCIRGLAGCL